MKKLTVLFLGLLAAATLSAAPFARWFDFPGAGGKTYPIYGEGDEFTAWFEAEDGHAVGFNDAAKAYEYLKPAADGSLVGTGILVGDEAGHEAELAAIPLHARDTSAAHDEKVRARMEEFDRANQVSERWEDVKAKTAIRNMAEDVVTIPGVFMTPSWKTVETLVGATILVDFPAEDGSGKTLWQTKSPGITVADIDAWLNATNGTTRFGNYCSARQYYRDVSNNKFDYSQVIVGPYTMPHPRSYYDDPTKAEVNCADLLFADLKNISFSSEDRTKISKASDRGVNVIFAGPEASRWSYGLWAHMATASRTLGGKTFKRYNISPLGYSPVLYGFCHENGHMMCDFPDFYSYSGLSHTMVGTACLMAARADDRSPSTVSAYLRMHAGWVTPKDLKEYNNSYVTIERNVNDVYMYSNRNNENEYYLIENRGGGHDGSMCGGGRGILIWHCNEDGGNTSVKERNPAFAAETDGSQYRISKFELTLEQADGLYHMERSQNTGDANDLWHSGNTAAGYPGEFTDLTVPTAKWMDNTASGLVLSEFSSNGGTMTFAVGTPVVEGAPTIADQITAGGYVGTGKLAVSNFGTGASSADVFIDIYGEATRKTLIASIKVATGLTSTSQKTYTFPLVADRTSQYVRFRVVNNLGKAAYGTLVEAANGKAGDSTGGWGTTGGNDFGAAVDAPSLVISGGGADGYAEWQKNTTVGVYMTAPACLNFHASSSSTRTLKSTISATVAGPGTFTFYASSQLYMNGNGSDKTLGNPQCSVVFTAKNSSGQQISTKTIPCTSTTKTSYTAYSVNLPSGNNTLTWEGSWIDPVSGTYNAGNIYIDKFLLEKNVAATIPIAKITTSSLQPDRATVSAQVTDKADESSVNVTSIVVSPNSDYSSPVYSDAPGLVTGLQPLTRYYVQATLTGASGETYPAIGSFVTPDWTKPTGSVTVSSVQHYSATVDVSVTNPGSENAADIVKTVTVARDSSFAEVVKNGASVPCELTGLDAGTTYYVRGILTGPLTGNTYVDTTFTTLSASYPLIGSVASSDVGTDRIAVNVTVAGFGDGSSGGTVLVEAVSGDTVAASANGTASGVYELTGLDRDTEYTIRVTVTGSNGLSTTDESLVVKTLNVPVILADPKSSIGEEGASATMSARVAFREATVTDSNVKLYLTKVGESETLAKTWNSYAQGDVLSFAADTDPNVDYTYRFVATTKWNSKDWTAEVAGEFRTEYYVTNDWLTVDFESYEVDKPLPASDASGAWTKAVGGVYESASSVVDFASEFGKGKGLDQSGESTYAKYTATAARPDGIRCLFDADMYFTVCKVPPESLTTEVLATATTAIFLYSGDEANNFRVYTADGWTDVFAEGFEPASKTFHHVTIDVDYDVSPARVRFTVDGRLLTDANGVKWFNRANQSKTDLLTAVSVYGNTKLDGFSAKMLEYGNTACPHANKQMTSAGQDATCTEAGHTAAYYCPDCERVWPSVEIPALGHAWNNGEITKPATYRDTGVMTYTCTREGCGATRTETIEKPVCPHAHTTVTGASAATCTTAGSTGTEKCDDCDAIIHTASVIAALGHDWDAGVVTQEPTRTAEGIRTFTCKRTGCGATQTESIPMLPNIAAMRNIALVATVGQTLTLPEKVRGLRPDATQAEEYAVAWQQSSVTPSSEGITTVNGTVTVSPLTFDVKATIRAVKVSNPDTTPANIAPDATCSLANSGVMFDGTKPTSGSKASTGAYSASAGDMTLTWTDDKIVSKAVIYFYSDKNSSQPDYSSVAFKNGTTTIGYGSPVPSQIYQKKNGSKDLCYQVTYNFANPVTLSSLKITLPACQIEELEVYGTDVPTVVTADPLTTDTLASLEVDYVAVPGFAPTTYSYTVTDGEAITSATATDNANMGITILPKDNEKAYVVTLAENDGSTKTYTVSMPPSVVCTHEHTTVTGATDATCTTAGSTGTETCNDCHAVIHEATVIPALGHDWSDWAVTKEASKTESGLRERNCQRVGCNAHEEEVIPMIVDIAALRNIAVVTAVGTAPTLPAKVAGLKADGTVGGEYDVVWNTASAPSAVGITPVTGTAQVNGTPMTVTASVRAEVPPSGDLVNIAPLASSMTVAVSEFDWKECDQQGPEVITNGYGNVEMKINDWNNPGGGNYRNIWYNAHPGENKMTVSFAWGSSKSISKVFLAVYDGNAHGDYILKNGATGETIPASSYTCTRNGSQYYKINQGEGVLIEFAQPVSLSELEVIVEAGSTWVAYFEIEVWAQGGGSVEPTTTDTLTALAVDGTPIAGFAPTTYNYSVDNGAVISSAVNTNDNVGITILPKYEGSAYVVTLAENGTATQKYTVAMPFVEDPPVEVHTLTLDPKGGTVSSTTVDLPAQSLPTPTRDGYHFVGWFKDDVARLKAKLYPTSGNINLYPVGKYLFGTPLTSAAVTDADTTLYAKWVKNDVYNHFSGKKAVFVGDSVTTLAGYAVRNEYPYNAIHYTEAISENYELNENTTWWGQLVQALDMTRLSVNAVSGSPLVDASAIAAGPRAMSCVKRIDDIDVNGTPDVVFIFGGINDFSGNGGLSQFNDFDPSADYLTGELDTTSNYFDSFAKGYATMIRRIRSYYPQTEIVAILPYVAVAAQTDAYDKGCATITNLCDYFQVPWVDLRTSGLPANWSEGIPLLEDSIHPNSIGFAAFANCFLENYVPACAHEHKTALTGVVAATCTTDGYSGDCTCEDCGETILGHVITKLGHDWSDWATTKDPSTTETGLRERNCQRVGCSAHEEEVIPKIAAIVALRNVAVVTAVGTAPELPAKVAGLKADGTVDGEYDVVWNSASAPAAAGITTVNGTAQVNGEAMSVTASVRAANASSGDVELINVAPLASSLVVSAPGVTKDLGDYSTITNGMGAAEIGTDFQNCDTSWINWNSRGITPIVNVDFSWDSTKRVKRIFVATYCNGGTFESMKLYAGPDGAELSPSSTINTKDQANHNVYYFENKGPCMLYEFTTPVELSALRVVGVQNGGQAGTTYMLGFYEIEVWAEEGGSGGSVEPTTTDTLTALAVDGNAVAGFAPTTYAYTVTNGTTITSAVNANDNVGITILPKFEGSAYVVTLAENGTATQKYTVAMPTVEICHHQHTTLTGAIVATCEVAGYTGDTVCDDCHETIQTGSVIPALGHDWGEWVTTKDATETETGLKRRECQRDNCDAFEEQVIPKIAAIVALRNVAVVTAVGTAPTLPAKVVGLKADGTVSGEYDVVWETATAPAAVGITTVTGTAQVNGAAMTVTASVRAANASSGGGELVNYSPSATFCDATANVKVNDKEALKNGTSVVGSDNHWDSFICYNNGPGEMSLSLGWDSPVAVSEVHLYFSQGGNYQGPDNVRFFDDSGASPAAILNFTAGDTVDKDKAYAHIVYTFATPQTLSKIRFVATAEGELSNRYLLVRRMWVFGSEGGSGGSVDPLTTDTLSALSVDGNAVAGFAPTTYSYTVENGTAITSATSTDNVGITILPKYEGSAYVVTLAENGTATQKYAVAMPAAVPQATVKIIDRSGKETTVTKPLDEIVDAINSAVASADYGSKVILPALDTDYTVTLAPGVRVVKNADSTGTVTLVIPSALSGSYVLNDAGDAMKLSEGVRPVVTDIQTADGVSIVTIGNVKVDLYYAVIKSETLFGFETASVVATSGRITAGETFVFELPHGGNEPQAFYKVLVTDDPAKADDPRGGGGGEEGGDDDPITVDITQYTWCSLGTSITDFNDDPITGRTKGYQFFLMDELEWDRAKLVNAGHSGTLVSSSSSKPPETPCDIYTVEYGVNDWGTGHPVGTLDDYKNYLYNGNAVRWNNFASCYRNLIEMIKAVNPNAVIVLITPRKAYGSSSDAGTKMFPSNCDDPTLSESVGDYYDPAQGANVHGDQTYLKDYADLIKAIGEYEGFPVVDWYSSAATQANLASLSVDNAVHPNDAGYEVMADLLKPVLLKAVQDKAGGGGGGGGEGEGGEEVIDRTGFGPWNIQVLDPYRLVMQFDGAYSPEKNYVESGVFSTASLTTDYNAIKTASFTVNGAETAQAGHAIAARGQMSYTNAQGQAEIVGGTNNQNWELRAVHNLYLTLASPLVEGENTVLTPDNRTLKFNYGEGTVSPLFKVNQVGYAASAAEKYVYLGGWMGTAGTFPLDDSYSFEVVNASSGATALTGSFTKRMNDPTSGGVAMTGEKTLEADISALTTTGTYYVRVNGLGRSMDFRVSDDAAADQFAVHMLGLYQQRCGCAKEEPYTHWTDSCCHQKVYRGVHPSNDDEYEKCFGGTAQSAFSIISANAASCTEQLSIIGGWHDAADYDRRPYHLQVVIGLANVYLMKPGNFTDGQLAIPEKNNGIPDILDEADWGLKFYLAAQQQDDGGVGGWAETVTHPDYGNKKMPSDDKYKLQYYLGRATRRSTLKYCGAAANLARALYAVGTAQATARADVYKASAVKAWNYVMNSPRQQNIEMKVPNGSTVKYTEPAWYDPYEYAKAAINLGVITGNPTYFNHLSDNITYRGGGRDNYNYGSDTGPYPVSGFFGVDWSCISRDESFGRDGFILSEVGLSCAADSNADYLKIKNGWINRVKANADEIITSMSSMMAYRNGALSAKAWGASGSLRNAEWLCAAHFFTGDAKYLKAAQLASDYQSGCNPLGMTWTSGLGKIYPVAFLSLHSFADSIAEYVPGITPFYNTGSDFGYLFNNTTMTGRYTNYQAETKAKPLWRRFEVGENMSIGISEYTVTETIGPCAAASGYLINAGHTTANLNWRQPAAKLSDLPGYWALP